jgi:hypothetical protein
MKSGLAAVILSGCLALLFAASATAQSLTPLRDSTSDWRRERDQTLRYEPYDRRGEGVRAGQRELDRDRARYGSEGRLTGSAGRLDPGRRSTGSSAWNCAGRLSCDAIGGRKGRLDR